MAHTRDMTKDATAALIPLSVIFFGIDWVSGHPLATIMLDFLSQNGF